LIKVNFEEVQFMSQVNMKEENQDLDLEVEEEEDLLEDQDPLAKDPDPPNLDQNPPKYLLLLIDQTLLLLKIQVQFVKPVLLNLPTTLRTALQTAIGTVTVIPKGIVKETERKTGTEETEIVIQKTEENVTETMTETETKIEEENEIAIDQKVLPPKNKEHPTVAPEVPDILNLMFFNKTA